MRPNSFYKKMFALILACVLITAAVPVYATDGYSEDLSGAVLSEEAPESGEDAVTLPGDADDGEQDAENAVPDAEDETPAEEPGGTDAVTEEPVPGALAGDETDPDGSDPGNAVSDGEDLTDAESGDDGRPETGWYRIRTASDPSAFISYAADGPEETEAPEEDAPEENAGEAGEPGEMLILAAEDGSASQAFYFEAGEGSFTIRPFLSEEPFMVAEEDGETVIRTGLPENAADGQALLEAVPQEDGEENEYRILFGSDPGVILDTKEHKTEAGTVVTAGDPEDPDALTWVLSRVTEEELGSFAGESAAEEDSAEDPAEDAGEAAEETAEEELPAEEEPETAEEDEPLLTTLEDFAVIEDGIYSIAPVKDENQSLDIAGGSKKSGGNVQIYRANETVAQLFTFTKTGEDTYKITNVGSGLALDVSGSRAEKGANIQQWRPNGSVAQTWRLKKVEEGVYELHSAVGAGYVMDCTGGKTVNGTNIQLWRRNGSLSQQFRISAVGEQEYVAAKAKAETVYTIRTAVGSKFVLDVYNGQMTNGGNVQIYTENGTNAQKWRMVKDGDYYTIISAKSGKALDVKKNGKVDGTNVQQWTPNGSAAQKWKVVSAGNGWYHIVAANGLYLNVWDGIAKNGTNVCLWTKDGSTEQKFKIEKTTIDPLGLFTDSDGVRYNQNEEPIIASAQTLGPQRPHKGKTLGNYLLNSLVPVGRTMYIWGGGHNASTTGGAIADCSVIGYRATWEAFFIRKASAGYSYLNYKYRYGAGLDCSGFVGWTLYNTMYSQNNQNWLCWTSGKTALKYIEEGWATEGFDKEKDKIKKKFYPGDVVSMDGHVWISLGQCSDGSVLLVHSSPNGVQIAGTVTSKGKGNSEAYQLADKYMKKYYPNWPYATVCCGKNYLKGLISVAHWKVSGSGAKLSDPEGYQNMTPAQVLQNLLGAA